MRTVKLPPPTVKKREVSVEALRVVSMFLVLMIHYIPMRRQATIDTIACFNPDEIFTILLNSVAFVCVNCFILISGYFGIRWKWRSFGNLMFQILFWNLVAAIFAMCVSGEQIQIACRSIISNLFQRWFIVAYIGLYILSPVLNSFIEKCDERTLLLMLAAFYGYSTIYGYIGHCGNMNEGMSCISLMGLYLVGAYLRKAGWLQRFRPVHYMCGFVACALTLTLCSILLLLLGIGMSPFGYLNPIVIIESVFLFLFFKTVRIKEHGWILFMSSSVFAAYLFHTNSLIYPVFLQTCKYIVVTFAPLPSFVVAIAFLLTVLVVAVLVDKMRLNTFERLFVIR